MDGTEESMGEADTPARFAEAAGDEVGEGPAAVPVAVGPLGRAGVGVPDARPCGLMAGTSWGGRVTAPEPMRVPAMTVRTNADAIRKWAFLPRFM